MKVFLGGTVAGSKWRDEMMAKLKIDYFNPVVKEWNDEAYQRELQERIDCDYCLYVLTPKMEGYYSLAEIIDDSFKRPDKTILCCITDDEGTKYTDYQQNSLEYLQKVALENGAIIINSLDEVTIFLNSAYQRTQGKSDPTDQYTDVFISYGRRHSIHFARTLHDKLVSEGKKVWFDMNNIPLAVDFQEQIDDGIEKADNFIFVISPHSVKSEYCLKEIVLALKYHKRIIPILHVEPTDCWDKLHPEIGKRNWIYMRQPENFSIPMDQWVYQDDFTKAFAGLLSVVNNHKEYIRKHTELLNKALSWEKNSRRGQNLLIANERNDAEKWLLTFDFKDNISAKQVQPPCFPTNLHAQFIVESKKNANNLQTEAFFNFSETDSEDIFRIESRLVRHCISTWLYTRDIEKGAKWEESIYNGIIQADNFLYFLTPESVKDTQCLKNLITAIQHNKRIIPIVVKSIIPADIPKEIMDTQNINFVTALEEDKNETIVNDKILSVDEIREKVERDVEQRKDKKPFDVRIDEILQIIKKDEEYYHRHKILLSQAIKWKKNALNSFLLRGYNLENAKIWLREGQKKKNPPLSVHSEFVEKSMSMVGMLNTDVFLSYSRQDADFARKINEQLQLSGKTTWFDQENIASVNDVQIEINKGIEESDNFVIIISPNSVRSPECEDEVNHAQRFNKRIVALMCARTDTKDIPNVLKKAQWIDFTERDFNSGFTDIQQLLDYDREYIQTHTKLSQQAIEWKESQSNQDFLLRGYEFTIAQKWLNESITKEKQPLPTDLHLAFIDASKQVIFAQKTKERQQRLVATLLIVVIVFLFIAIGFGWYAFLQQKEAESLNKIILVEKKKADSLTVIATERADTATIQQRKADSLRRTAESLRRRSDSLRHEASKSKDSAEVKAKQARQASRKADSLFKIAQISANQAIRAKDATKASKDSATYNLFLFNAANFATSSLEEESDNDLKVLLALTSYRLRLEALSQSKLRDYKYQYEPQTLFSLQDAYLNLFGDVLKNTETWNMDAKNNRIVFSSEPRTITICDLDVTDIPKLTNEKVIVNEKSTINNFVFNQTANMLAYSTAGGKLKVINLLTKKDTVLPKITNEVVSLAFIPAKRWLVYSDINNLRIWDLNKNQYLLNPPAVLETNVLFDINGKGLDLFTGIKQIAAARSDYLYALNISGDLIVASINTNPQNSFDILGKPILYSGGKQNCFRSIAYTSVHQAIITGTSDGKIAFVLPDKESGKLKIAKFPKQHKGVVKDIVFSNDNRWLATVSLDGSLLLWNLDNIQFQNWAKQFEKVRDAIKQLVPLVITNSNRKILSVSFSSDNNYLFYGDNKTIHIRPINEDMLYNKLYNVKGLKRTKLTNSEWNYYKRGNIDQP